jgi:hypothetical protein
MAKMAGKRDAKQKAGPCDRTEKSIGRRSGEPEKELQGDPCDQGRPKKRISPRGGREEAEASNEASLTKRRQVRKVATMVKRLKRSTEDSEQQHRAEAEAGQAAEGEWNARQQETVAAYARVRGMEPREVLQALMNSMEKTLRKERSDNLTGQAPSPKASQLSKSGGKPEAKARPESGEKGPGDKSKEARCGKKKRDSSKSQMERRTEGEGPELEGIS